ncbi:MerR family transcriptional regulator [Kitasatospora herbaricolor]|uniref:helix-turn-helix domain-containing protein n=1 Tax=Kitasatospora herbaricolor TaxID=68217 RepID=UPI00174BED2B|nr:MerR family transcriptional regulator [Kitasatospora herbaricolor]MDQ0307556.1 DNA-binding transcriptional MerR regulator [Kitasatospora herbaricolor]GGV16678.1 MerR family transcriptional regulator [Kitasatospora herbaricolor]
MNAPSWREPPSPSGRTATASAAPTPAAVLNHQPAPDAAAGPDATASPEATDRPAGYSIGELAETAGVSVKTVRFYSDSGLLPEAGRSPGGHRRYGAGALERLRTVRRLRALGLALPAVAEILHGEAELAGALARQREETRRQMAELRWREAALAAFELAGPEGLELLGEALDSPPGPDVLAAFWRRILPVRLPPRLMSAIVGSAVPELPADPTPQQALAYARLHALASDRAAAASIRDLTGPGPGCDAVKMYEGLGEAYALAGQELRAGRPPAAGGALDCFVQAHAAAERTTDSAGFRRGLADRTAGRRDLRMERYWSLAAELRADGEPDMGSAHTWLAVALKSSVRYA